MRKVPWPTPWRSAHREACGRLRFLLTTTRRCQGSSKDSAELTLSAAPGRGFSVALALPYALIQPSAWSRHSANFRFTGFSEVREKASNNRSFEGCAVRLRACRLIYASSDGTRAEGWIHLGSVDGKYGVPVDGAH